MNVFSLKNHIFVHIVILMEEKLVIKYQRFDAIDQMSAEDQELARAAVDAMKGSYAPHSQFHVGAAVRLKDGQIIKGANQENAAYPSGLCAERTAMFAANANNPGVPQTSIAITSAYADGTVPEHPATPCGACRQVMAEYQKVGKEPMSVILIGAKEILKFDKVDDILPFIFTSLD